LYFCYVHNDECKKHPSMFVYRRRKIANTLKFLNKIMEVK
jgi:hypothetical protein